MRTMMLKLWEDSGVDPKEAISSMLKERNLITSALHKEGGSMGPVHGFVVPTLRNIGLYSDRIAAQFKEMWSANLGANVDDHMATNDANLRRDLDA